VAEVLARHGVVVESGRDQSDRPVLRAAAEAEAVA
jgi:hypothetical protein